MSVQFDSTQILPLFRLISPKADPISKNLMSDKQDMQHKQRKKRRPEVPVHKSKHGEHISNEFIPEHKTFSANFHRNKHRNEKDFSQNENPDIEHKVTEENEDISKVKIRRKHLVKENDRIITENQQLSEQLMLAQNIIAKKENQIMKLREKVQLIQANNEEVTKENNLIKIQYEDILTNLEEFKAQLKVKVKCKTCEDLEEIIKRQSSDLEILKSNNNELTEDLNMLKNVIYRLNVQLERYQQKIQQPNVINCPRTNVSDTDVDILSNQNNIISQNIGSVTILQHNDHLHTPVSWGNVNSHTLGPLLDAYQDTIKEKEDIIANYEIEFVNFTQKLKSIISENEMLHRKSNQESEILQKNTSELEASGKELKVLKDQNDLLIKKCALKHDKLTEICKVYDHKVDTMRRDYEVLQEQFHKTRIELSNLQGKYKSLTDVHDSLKSDKENVIPLAVHTASVNECKRLFEELKNQYDIEKTKLENQIKLLEQQISEMQSKIVESGTEKQELLIKVKAAEKHIKKLEQKLTENHNLLTHTQISRDACKRQLGKAIEFGRELVTEQESLLQQLSSRHKENKAVKKIGSNIVTRMDVLKTQLKSVQKDAFQQLASVEQRIQQQDSSMESMRRDHEQEIEKLLQEIHDKDDYIARLANKGISAPSSSFVLYREKHTNS